MPPPAAAGGALIFGWVLALTLALGLATVYDRASFLVFGWAACLIVSLPTLGRRYDLVSPWSLVMVTVYVGCGIRPIFISAQIEGGGRSLDSLFLLGREASYFTLPSLLFLGGLTLLTAGYVLGSARARSSSRIRLDQWRFSRMAPFVIGAAALIGLTAFLLFAQRTGGLSLASLSSKRTAISSLDLRGYESHGLLRQLSEFSSYAYWVAVAFFATQGKRSPGRLAVLVVLFLNAIALPVYASSRSDAGYVLVTGLIIGLILDPARSRRSGRIALRGALVVAVIVTSLTTLRSGTGSASDLSADNDVTETVGQTFVYNRNFIDITTSSQIIRAVPERLAPARGATYLAWVAAPVPRQWWPNKPLVSSGPEIGVRVFGQVSSGVPPGLIAESYWNFGIPGVLLISLFAGLGLGRVYEWWRPQLGSPLAAVIYAGAFFRIGEGAFTNSLGYAVFQAGLGVVVLYTLMVASSTRRDPDRAAYDATPVSTT